MVWFVDRIVNAANAFAAANPRLMARVDNVRQQLAEAIAPRQQRAQQQPAEFLAATRDRVQRTPAVDPLAAGSAMRLAIDAYIETVLAEHAPARPAREPADNVARPARREPAVVVDRFNRDVEDIPNRSGKDIARVTVIDRNDGKPLNGADVQQLFNEAVADTQRRFGGDSALNFKVSYVGAGGAQNYISSGFVPLAQHVERGHPVFASGAVLLDSSQGEDEIFETADELLEHGKITGVVSDVKRGAGHAGLAVKNDCFATLVIQLAPVIAKAPNSADLLKHALGIREDAMIPTDAKTVSRIEDIYKMRINVIGRAPSEKSYVPQMTVLFDGGHAYHVPDPDAKRAKINEVVKPYPQSKIDREKYYGTISYFRRTPDEYAVYSDNKGRTTVDKARFRGLYFSCLARPAKSDKLEDLKATYDDLAAAQNYMFHTVGIDISKYRTNGDAALGIYQHLTTYELAPVNVQESEFMRRAYMGGLIWCTLAKDEFIGKRVISLDVNSMYLYKLKQHMYPTAPGAMVEKRAEYQAIVDEAMNTPFPGKYTILAKLPYGLFECEIERPAGALRFVPANRGYTVTAHPEIKSAVEHGLRVTFGRSAMIWNKDQLHRGIFGKFADVMFDCKQKTHSAFSKIAGVAMWGKLSSKYQRKKKFARGQTVVEDDELYVGVDKLTKEGAKIFTRPADQPYHVMAPYIGLFLTAFARDYVNQLMDTFDRKTICRIHTDGFIVLDTPAMRLEISPAMGKMKVEAAGVLEALDNANRYKIRLDNGKAYSRGFAPDPSC